MESRTSKLQFLFEEKASLKMSWKTSNTLYLRALYLKSKLVNQLVHQTGQKQCTLFSKGHFSVT